MKKEMKTLLALMAGALAFSACSNEDVLTNETVNVAPEAKGIRTFTAFIEGDSATRATIDGFSVKWQSEDAISVIVGNWNYDKYNLSAGENTSSGTFEANGSGVYGDEIYAVYPYREDVEYYVSEYEARQAAEQYGVTITIFDKAMSGGTLTALQQNKWNDALGDETVSAYVNGTPIFVPAYDYQSDGDFDNVILPEEQTVAAGQSVDPKAMLMVAKSADAENLTFKNVCAYIKVTPTVALNKIVVSANNDEDLAGNLRVRISDDAPTAYVLLNNSSSVTLKAEDGDLAAGTYYIAVLPGTLSSGLSIKFYTDGSNYTESSISTPFTFERSKVYDGGSQP